MQRREKTGWHVVAAISSERTDGRDVRRGIEAAASAFGWTLDLVDIALTGSDLDPFRRVLDMADGVIANGRDLADGVVALMPRGLPLVSINIDSSADMPSTAATWAFVGSDDRRIGGAAAEELLSLGLRCCAFVPMLGRYSWTKARGNAFLACVRAVGGDARLYSPRTEWGWVEERDYLAEWLSRLPRPFGVFAGNDLLARFALDACREADLVVPRDAAIVGADDDELLCLSSSPTLSSVRIDFEGAGRLAAKRLDALMGGPKPRRPAVSRYGILGVARRGSTRLGDPGTDLRVAAGLAFISAHFADPLVGSENVAAAMGVCRRQAERLFRATGKGIRAHVEERRLEAVRLRLRGTDDSVADIARTCGFASDTYLSDVFRRRHGCAPGAWRLKNR